MSGTPQAPATKPTLLSRRWVLRSGGLIVVAGALIGGAIATRPRRGASPTTTEPTSDVPTYPPAGTLTAHTHEVRDVAFGPDGTLVSISWDHTIRLWDLASRQQRLTIDTDLEEVPGSAERMAVSSTGHIATTGFSDTVVVWSLATGQPIAELAGHTGYVNAVAVSPDGQTLASSGMDNAVRLWNTTNFQQVDVLRADTSAGLMSLAWSLDGTQLAVGDGAGRAWLVRGGEITSLPKHDGWLYDLAFSPDGRLLAGCGYGGKVPVWDVTDRRRVATMPGTFTGVRGVAFSPDGRTLATGTDDNTVQLWNLADRRHFATLTGTGPGHAVMAVAYSPDGTLIAAAGADKTVQLWEARS